MRSRHLALLVVGASCALAAHPSQAEAFNPLKPVCTVASLASGLLGKTCDFLQNAGHLYSAGKKLLGGHVGSALKTVLGEGASVAGSHATTALGLAAIGAWALGGAKFVLHETAKVLGKDTTPRLGTTWFSATYWRVAGIAALLTLPFLFAAAVQALTRSDLALLLRAVLGYLPLAMLAVSVGAPLTMLLLSGSDELSTLVASATGQPGARALGHGLALAGALTVLSGSPFFVFFLALIMAVGALALWMELLLREVAVYVVVLMLPLAFAALVWPARRAWAIRAVELLVALILSKFAIVAVLSLGGAAMNQDTHSLTAVVVGLVLVILAVFSPWALLRLVPLAEVATSAVGGLRGEARGAFGHAETPFAVGDSSDQWATRTVAEMREGAADRAPVARPNAGPEPAAHAGGGPAVSESPDEGTQSTDPTESDPGAALVDDPLPGPGTTDGRSGATDYADPLGDEPAASLSPEPPADSTARDQLPERLPGLPEMWQGEDGSWRPLVLGTEGGWPPRVWPPQPDGGGAASPAEDVNAFPPVQEGPLSPPTQPPPTQPPPPQPPPPQPPSPQPPPPLPPKDAA
jgi:hypothetical protein